jgi:predicted dehydrogenase
MPAWWRSQTPCASGPSSGRPAFGIPAVYDRPIEMIEREALAAIDIASPRETHVAITRNAIAHGVAILCQKPLAPKLRQSP